ncbi:MAG: hypothetical protein OK442_08060 [Thaumarchaeota archaeon]|nr:hypothetical protein [Nitrososphaerota archaeon]
MEIILLSAALVGIIHMSAPDHWVTLIILSRISKWTRSRLLGVAAMTATGHVAFSILLGFVVVGLGLAFSEVVSTYATYAIGASMVVIGLAYGIRELRSDVKEDYEEEVSQQISGTQGVGKRFRYFAVMGAALSPDLAILPVFLLAVKGGLGLAVESAIVFAVASILALMILVTLGIVGLSTALERVPPKYNDALVGFVIAGVGAYVLLAG